MKFIEISNLMKFEEFILMKFLMTFDEILKKFYESLKKFDEILKKFFDDIF